jgi:hypothetical protein
MAINLIVTTQGALTFLESAVNWQLTFAPQDWTVFMFQNNITVTDATVIGDFVPATTLGVTGIIPTWAAVALVGGVPARVGSTITFTQTSGFPKSYYGVVVLDGDYTHLVAAANFTAPVVLTSAQPSYSAQVTVTAISQY